MFQSLCEERGKVTFPVFTGERVYMQEFRKKDGLPKILSRWQTTVDAMLEGVDTDGPIYLMIDQGVVKANATHRRPGLHIDGYWNPGLQAHGGGSPGHRSATARHSPFPTHSSGAESWSKASYEEHEGLILASDVKASRAVVGTFLESPEDMGDCSHVNTFGMKEIILAPNTIYAGNVTMLHESIPVTVDCQRTLVRLNVPGWTIH